MSTSYLPIVKIVNTLGKMSTVFNLLMHEDQFLTTVIERKQSYIAAKEANPNTLPTVTTITLSFSFLAFAPGRTLLISFCSIDCKKLMLTMPSVLHNILTESQILRTLCYQR